MMTTLLHKLFITVRFGTSQLKVTVCYGNSITGLVKQPQHDHGIQPSADSQKDFIGSFAKLVTGDMIIKKF